MIADSQLLIGSRARCSDGACGVVRGLVVDPVARSVTHLVVDPEHGKRCGRLVPSGFVDSSAETVLLRCSLDEFDRFPAAEETEFLAEPAGPTSAQVLRWPYYTLGRGGSTSPVGYDGETGYDAVTYDAVPLGEVGIRRGDAVHATDGEIGHVQGLVVDPGTHGVTHVLLREGHLWGRRDVTIPIGSVTDLTFGVHVGLTRDQIGDLPDLHVDRDEETPVTPA